MMQHHNTGAEYFWDIMRHRNPGQSLSGIWCSIITQEQNPSGILCGIVTQGRVCLGYDAAL